MSRAANILDKVDEGGAVARELDKNKGPGLAPAETNLLKGVDHRGAPLAKGIKARMQGNLSKNITRDDLRKWTADQVRVGKSGKGRSKNPAETSEIPHVRSALDAGGKLGHKVGAAHREKMKAKRKDK